MAQNKEEKVVIIATHGGEDPERATLPFVVANAALAMDVKATVVFQGVAVTLAVKGANEHIFAGGFPPLKELMDSFAAQGGQLLLCTPCLKERKIGQDMLVAGAQIVAGGRVVQECLEASSTLNY